MVARLIFLSSSALAALDALLVMLSCLLGASGRTVLVSAAVALIFVGIAALLFVIHRQLAAAGKAARETRHKELAASLGRLGRYLTLAAASVGLVLLAALAMILQRMSEGYAAFG